MYDKIKDFLPYGRQNITDADISAVVNVLKSPLITQGEQVPLFEQAIVQRVGSKFGVAVNSATSALHIACLALGLGPGDALWTSSTTFVASANCGLYCGASVDFVDINPFTGLMDIEALQYKLKRAEKLGKLPKIVVPVHLTGASCDMSSISSLAKQYGFFVIEDASHAIGGTYQEKPVGSCSYSDITVFSFHPVKIITTGEGGLATTNDGSLYQAMVNLRSHGIIKDKNLFIYPSLGSWSYEQQLLGFNYRMTDIQAALGLSQLNRLDEIVNERNYLYGNYQKMFDNLPVHLLTIPSEVSSSVHLAVIRLFTLTKSQHKRLFDKFRESAIGVQLHYAPVHLQPYYRSLGFSEGDFPESEAYTTNSISIPLYPGLLKSDQARVYSVLANFLAA